MGDVLACSKRVARGYAVGDQLESLHRIIGTLSKSDPYLARLARGVHSLKSALTADSCFLYVLEGNELVLRASDGDPPESVGELRIPVGKGITGWVAHNRQPVTITSGAAQDPRFHGFSHLPEERFEAFLSLPVLVGGQLVGVLNLQHAQPHEHQPQEVKLASTVAQLMGSQIERWRLESEVALLSEQLATRKLVERARGVLERDLGLTPEEARQRMRQELETRHERIRQVARELIDVDDVTKPGL